MIWNMRRITGLKFPGKKRNGDDDSFDKDKDEKFCLNGGTCTATGPGTQKCECNNGFEGVKCENRLTTEPPEETPTPCKTGEMNCSESNYRCPYVDCPTCLSCQERIYERYTTGPYKGCVETEKCGEKKLIELEKPCTGCQVKDIKNQSYPLLDEWGDCQVEYCRHECKPHEIRPQPNGCQELVVDEDNKHQCSGCNNYKVKPVDVYCLKDKCAKRVVDENECRTSCVNWTIASPCDKDCQVQTEEGVKNEETCTIEVKCEDRSCESLDRASDQCIMKKVPNKNDTKRCTCEFGEVSRIAVKCGICVAVTCEVNPPPCPENPKCGRYHTKVKINCLENQKKYCSTECQDPWECHCRSPRTSCPPSHNPVKRKCPTDCGNCCEEICERNDQGNLEETDCELNCRVCPGDEGASLKTGKWENKEYCHADKECCTGCLLASNPNVICPSNWNDAKKQVCGCNK